VIKPLRAAFSISANEKKPSKKRREEIHRESPPALVSSCVGGFFAELFQLDQEHLEGLVGQVLGKVASARQPHRLARLAAVLFGFAVGKCEA
jgi:hypothetical protein